MKFVKVGRVPRGVYMGQNTRQLVECFPVIFSLGISPITSILSHINASGHPANFDDFQILSSSSDAYELMIHESSH